MPHFAGSTFICLCNYFVTDNHVQENNSFQFQSMIIYASNFSEKPWGFCHCINRLLLHFHGPGEIKQSLK